MTDPLHTLLIPEDQRLSVPHALFGHHFLIIETTVYAFADYLSRDYRGGYWDFYTVSNGGFYMAPSDRESFGMNCPNGFEGVLTAEAFGITCCLYTYSQLSFSENPTLSELGAEHYHRLRAVILGHPEGGRILAAAD